MAISAPGIGSGLDVNSIVEQLIQLERRPLAALDRKEAGLQQRLSVIGSVKGALSALQTAVRSMASADAVAFKASSSEATMVSAVGSAASVAGSHSVSVTQLAQAQKLVAAGQASATAAIGAGTATTLTFSFGTISGGTFDNDTGKYTGAAFAADAAHAPFTVEIGATNNTLEGIRDAINAAGNDVTASIVNDGSGTPYRLALSVADTGAANSLKVEVSGEAAIAGLLAHDPAATQNLSQTAAARNAALTIDGVAISRTTNSVADAIAGVTLTLRAVTSSPVTVTVQRDYGAASLAAASLVEAYNGVNTAIAEATAKGATLQGDFTVLGLQQRLRSALGATYATTGAYPTLSALGITQQMGGALSLNAGKLSAALEADPTRALAAFTAAGDALTALVDGALSVDGAIEASSDRIESAIHGIDERRAALERRLVRAEQRYRAQYAALDAFLGSMNQTSAFLTQQLARLPDPNAITR